MEQRSSLIAHKELFPILVAATLWGSQWVYRRVEFLCDNESVVAVLKSGSSRDQHLMGLLRHLSLLAIRHSFMLTTSSVRGMTNLVADSLSRFQFQHFCLLAPQADPTPCVIRHLDPEVSVSAIPTTRAFHPVCLPLLNIAILTFDAGMVALTAMAPADEETRALCFTLGRQLDPRIH